MLHPGILHPLIAIRALDHEAGREFATRGSCRVASRNRGPTSSEATAPPESRPARFFLSSLAFRVMRLRNWQVNQNAWS